MKILGVALVRGTSPISGVLAAAESEMWAQFQTARAFANTGDTGTARELAVARFLSGRLPTRYQVARGEVVDAAGAQSGQTDILIFDGSLTAPLLRYEDGLILLPAEALLATVEVKSRLTTDEIRKSLRGIQKLRAVRPYGSPWGLARHDGDSADDGLPNFFSTVFAFESTITQENWIAGEIERIRSVSADVGIPTQWADRFVVLSRGVVLPSAGRVASFVAEQQVLGLWFYHLMNFLARESERRSAFPWALYERGLAPEWKRQLSELRDAPAVRKASARQRRRYLRLDSRTNI